MQSLTLSLQSQKLHLNMKQNQLQGISSLPSILSGLRLPPNLPHQSQLSLQSLFGDELSYLDLNKLSSSASNDPSPQPENLYLVEPQLKRCTSFETMLMENHRNVMVGSIRDYFQSIGHEIVRKVRANELRYQHPVTQESQILEKEKLLEDLISRREGLAAETKDRLVATLRTNLDEVLLAEQTIRFCPAQIQYEVLYLIGIIFLECQGIVQHFNSRGFKEDLEQRSAAMAKQLTSESTIRELFVSPSLSKGEVLKQFETLVQKWMITLFLMKVGVFENELQQRGIQECFRSETLSEVNLNDLVSQNLVRPGKKVKRC